MSTSTNPSQTVWIVGTSVSIEAGGYVTQLEPLLDRRAVQLKNLSVGDQTSLMGYMRVLAHIEQMHAGDLVVWEYSLLDTLLTAPVDSIFPAADVHDARRLAWRTIRQRGADVFVLLTPPRRLLAQRSECEELILADARRLGLRYLDGRDAFTALGVTDPQSHYRDDRHPLLDSPLLQAMAGAVVQHLPLAHIARVAAQSATTQALALPDWHWRSGRDLARGAAGRLQVFSNSLTSVEALVLSPGKRVAVVSGPLRQCQQTVRRWYGEPVWSGLRTIAIGIVSTHQSGCLWCGHAECAGTSTTLPDDLPYSFLLRATRSYCEHGLAPLHAEADPARARQCWGDYGQARPGRVDTVAITGILFTRSDVPQREPLRP